MLKAQGLRKTYRRGDEGVHAVDGVDLEVRRSELVGLVGRSGSGETTLLNVVAGWERPDEGEERLDGASSIGPLRGARLGSFPSASG